MPQAWFMRKSCFHVYCGLCVILFLNAFGDLCQSHEHSSSNSSTLANVNSSISAAKIDIHASDTCNGTVRKKEAESPSHSSRAISLPHGEDLDPILIKKVETKTKADLKRYLNPENLAKESDVEDFVDYDWTKPDDRPLLEFVMIVKNEAHSIEDTIISAKPWVDRYTILDTGSTDGT